MASQSGRNNRAGALSVVPAGRAAGGGAELAALPFIRGDRTVQLGNELAQFGAAAGAAGPTVRPPVWPSPLPSCRGQSLHRSAFAGYTCASASGYSGRAVNFFKFLRRKETLLLLTLQMPPDAGAHVAPKKKPFGAAPFNGAAVWPVPAQRPRRANGSAASAPRVRVQVARR